MNEINSHRKITGKTIRIYEICENINIPSQANPNVLIKCGVGDIVIIEGGEVWIKDWSDDKWPDKFSKPVFDSYFIEINPQIFKKK